MTVLWILLTAVLVLGGGGILYSRFLARSIGEDPGRILPSIHRADGRDYVATPTPVVFAHHFAAIAGAGPIVGPVLAIAFGWLPALIWVVIGGLFFGAVHDYLATYMATRHNGESVASIVRSLIGNRAFVAFVLFLLVSLALVTGMFLNLSATALTSAVEKTHLGITDTGGFRSTTVRNQAGQEVPGIIIGGIASTSVIIITLFAPLVGWLYIRRHVAIWKCSLLAVAICAVSILVGWLYPVSLDPLVWKLLLSLYVLLAAGAPVWMLLQSRDFINVHILYIGLALLAVILAVASVSGKQYAKGDETFTAKGMTVPKTVQAVSVEEGQGITSLPIWPMLFITIACGAVSGFHSLCAGGTTCKQLTSEPAVRRVGFFAMLLESFLAVCVICVLIVGLDMQFYVQYVHPKVVDIMRAESNPVLAFAMAVGWAGHVTLNIPTVVGTLAGMILLEGFLVTTLDAAVRLMRYLFEEVWRVVFGRYDVFAAPVAPPAAAGPYGVGTETPLGAEGIPIAPNGNWEGPAPAQPQPTTGLARWALSALRHYWVNSGLAVALMLLFALTGGAKALWSIFATTNQLLAAMVLLLASVWLLREGRRKWFAFVPALFMIVTTVASLIFLLGRFWKARQENSTLLAADVVIIVLTAFLLLEGVMATAGLLRRKAAAKAA